MRDVHTQLARLSRRSHDSDLAEFLCTGLLRFSYYSVKSLRKTCRHLIRVGCVPLRSSPLCVSNACLAPSFRPALRSPSHPFLAMLYVIAGLTLFILLERIDAFVAFWCDDSLCARRQASVLTSKCVTV